MGLQIEGSISKWVGFDLGLDRRMGGRSGGGESGWKLQCTFFSVGLGLSLLGLWELVRGEIVGGDCHRRRGSPAANGWLMGRVGGDD